MPSLYGGRLTEDTSKTGNSGSNPAPRTTSAISSVCRAATSKVDGRGFDSYIAHMIMDKALARFIAALLIIMIAVALLAQL